jgi:hypothetical protein
MTPLLGAAAGFILLWWLLLSMWSKPIIQAEISRYIVVTRKTFLEAFSDMPGFKTTINGKTTSWLVWFMFVGVIPSVAGMGGLAGAVAEAGISNTKQTNQEVVFPLMVVLKPGMSENASKKVFLVTTMYLLISAWIIGLLHMLKSSHHSNMNPAAAPSSGVITIEPLPTTLPVTITLGPTYLSRSKRVFGAVVIKNLFLF